MTRPFVKCPGVGTKTVFLRDVPLEDRLDALSLALRTASEDEARKMLELVLDPGDAGGRVEERAA
jgi:hypothetical protein